MAEFKPIIYLTVGTVQAYNQEILRRAGQSSAFLREEGLLESALLRPQNAAYYEEADLVVQAALYMTAIAANHPFVDGNKRTGYVAGMAFLQLNGAIQLSPMLDDVETGKRLEDFVARRITFDDFVAHLRQRLA